MNINKTTHNKLQEHNDNEEVLISSKFAVEGVDKELEKLTDVKDLWWFVGGGWVMGSGSSDA